MKSIFAFIFLSISTAAFAGYWAPLETITASKLNASVPLAPPSSFNNISTLRVVATNARILVKTTTDDGTTALQVNGNIKANNIITSSNIAAQSVSYAATSGSSSTSSNSSALEGHTSSYFQPAATAINTGNISSQSVAYAASAGGVALPYEILYGTVSSSCTRLSGVGFTSSHISTGICQINFPSTYSAIFPTANSTTYGYMIKIYGTGASNITLQAINSSGASADDSMSFVAIGAP